MSYKKGLVMCTQYFGKLIGESFAKIVNKDFPKAFRDSINPKNKKFYRMEIQFNIAKKLIERLMRLVANYLQFQLDHQM